MIIDLLTFCLRREGRNLSSRNLIFIFRSVFLNMFPLNAVRCIYIYNFSPKAKQQILSEWLAYVRKVSDPNSGTHAWQELYNLFKLNTRFLGNESEHATILGCSERSEIVEGEVFSSSYFKNETFSICFSFPQQFFSSLLLQPSSLHEECIILWFTLKRNRKKVSKLVKVFLPSIARSASWWCRRSHETKFFCTILTSLKHSHFTFSTTKHKIFLQEFL